MNIRVTTIDSLRGIAFIFMIIHHIYYFYNVTLNISSNSLPDFVEMSGTIARTIFIILTGVSLSLGYHKKQKFESDIEKKIYIKNFYISRIQKFIKIAIHASLISLITYFYYPDKFIRFGVLHYIALSTLLLSFITPYKSLYIPILGLLLYIQFNNVIPPINKTVNTILGQVPPYYYMVDWFPLIKWLPYTMFGILIGSTFDFNKLNYFNNSILTKIGQNSLELYTLHMYILIIIYYKLYNKQH